MAVSRRTSAGPPASSWTAPNSRARPISRPGIAFSNRATAGSGHGWDVGWAVAWNVSSPLLLVQQPPGAMNWCIGCIGAPVTIAGTPNGIFDSLGKQVQPASLYLQQLRDRIGPDAVGNIGY